MGIYTDSHDGKRYSINIDYPELQMINNNPDFHFCWMSENEPIRDENSDYYEDEKNDNETTRVFKEQITVRTAAGKTITGRVWHWVCGPCAGTKLRDWFLICTKTYPYNRPKKQAWA
tara:strand:- start:2616 stop:2966 length:351 start_codon:yes stop_codon:yes gene_type:complete